MSQFKVGILPSARPLFVEGSFEGPTHIRLPSNSMELIGGGNVRIVGHILFALFSGFVYSFVTKFNTKEGFYF